MIGSWNRIFAFWRVAKVRYAYFGQWRAGETLCHILELYPWVFARSFNVGRFRDGWNGLSTRLNFVSSSSSLLYVSSSLLFSSLHQYEKEKRKKGYRNIIFMFVYFIKVLKHVTMTNYYNVFVSWLSQSKLQKKKERFFLPLQGFRSKHATVQGSANSCAGQHICLVFICWLAYLGCHLVLQSSGSCSNFLHITRA